MIYLVLAISFILECIFSNLVNVSSIFIPLFLITSFTILYPFFKKENHSFLITITIFGLIYDIIFYNSTFINTITFFICGLTIKFAYNFYKYNIFSSNIINVFTIIIYRIISYILLFLIGYMNFNISYLLKGIYSSIIVNVIYGIILYIIIYSLPNIFKIKRK